MELIDEYIDKVKVLPPAPRILVQLLSLLGQDDVDPGKIVQLITFDPVLTAKVIQVCNSATLRGAQPVQDLQEAVVRIGFNEVYRLVAAIVGEATLGGAQPGYGIAAGELWQHSVVSAVAARLLGRWRGTDENLLFTAALLHDIGKLVLSASLVELYDSLIKETEQSGHSFLEVEQLLLGVDHSQVGGRLLERWSFPENLVESVRHHHHPAGAGPHATLCACVYLGNMIAHLLGHSHGHQAYAVRAGGQTLELLQLTQKEVEHLLIQTSTALQTVNWFRRKEP
jgi:putative nucleotidyltransferase with HDIG domain